MGSYFLPVCKQLIRGERVPNFFENCRRCHLQKCKRPIFFQVDIYHMYIAISEKSINVNLFCSFLRIESIFEFEQFYIKKLSTWLCCFTISKFWSIAVPSILRVGYYMKIFVAFREYYHQLSFSSQNWGTLYMRKIVSREFISSKFSKHNTWIWPPYLLPYQFIKISHSPHIKWNPQHVPTPYKFHIHHHNEQFADRTTNFEKFTTEILIL